MKNNPRYFVIKGKNKPRHYWQPLTQYAPDFVTTRLDGHYPTALSEAAELNIQLDAWKISGQACPRAVDWHVPHLLDIWQTSAAFMGLAPSTQKYYRHAVPYIKADIGRKLIGHITAADVNTLYRYHKDDKPARAAQIVRTGQAAWSWAIRTGVAGAPDNIGANPWAKQKLKTISSKGSIWSKDDIDTIVEAADKLGLHSVGTAVLLMEWIGHNPQDIISLTRANIKNFRLEFKRGKTGQPVSVDCSPRLRLRLSQQTARQNAAGITSTRLLAAEHTKKPWKIDNFRKYFRTVRDTTGLTHLTMGRLRHTAVTNMFDAGILPMNIAAVTGHSLKTIEAILDRYNCRTAIQADTATTQRLHADERHR